MSEPIQLELKAIKRKRRGRPRTKRAAFEVNPGEKFSRLTFQNIVVLESGKVMWLMHCQCGNSTKVYYGDVLRGKTKSCGCLKSENRSQTTHGEGNSTVREYRAWSHIKERCFNPNCKKFKDYGGRGITMCERWANSYESFLADMGRCPEKHSIDRIDNDGNYEPSNCRWATQKEQCQHTRKSLMFTIGGRTQNLKQWASEYSVRYLSAYSRVKAGWSVIDALTKQAKRVKRLNSSGKLVTVWEAV